jgi:uncharacterized protein involved in type VI secretion and phage assembly
VTASPGGSGPPFYGKFRGVVSDNQDPLALGRLRARVPDVFGGDDSGWALPALPYAGDGVGLYLVPPVGAWVWVEFEQGDPDDPVWSGCFWQEGQQLPASPATPDKKMLRTAAGTLTLDDTPGADAVTVETANGMKIVIGSSGITVDNGRGATLTLTGTQVSINNGALEVT